MNNYLLSVEDLTMQFGGLKAVENVSFNLSKNQILAIIGPNGAGKTTIFNIITGIYKPTNGIIKYKNDIINGLSSHSIARIGIRRTFQISRLFNNLTVLDNVILGMASKQKSSLFDAVIRRNFIKKELYLNIEKALELIGYFSLDLKSKAYIKASELSQGDKRRLEICRALASDPEVLLLDEPSAGMDPEETKELMVDIRKIKDRQKDIGIILIEHDMSVVKNIADYVIVLSYGKLIAEGIFDEVSSLKIVQEAYLGKRKYSWD